MTNLKSKTVFFLSRINSVKFALFIIPVIFTNVAFGFTPSSKFLNSAVYYDTTGCDKKDTLDWKNVPEGAKESKQQYVKEGLATTISSTNKAGASASLRVGKKFRNQSSLEWSTIGARSEITSEISFNFSESPENFTLQLSDIDMEDDDVIDSLVVSAYHSGDLIYLAVENIINIGTSVSFTGNNSFIGVSNADDASSDQGNVSLNYFSPIDSVVLTMNNASGTAKVSSRQEVGVGNFSWCPAGRTPTPETETPSLIVSEALSPNGDNILDAWVIEGIDRYPHNDVKIFNVWGDMVFEQKHYDNDINPWRGESNQGAVTDQRIPDGTYYYILNPGDGSKLLKGFIMLKR
jgi:gliding motility-associated-like protein